MGEGPGSRLLRPARIAVILIAAAALAAIGVMWPGDVGGSIPYGYGEQTQSATVEAVERWECDHFGALPGDCGEATIRLNSGPDSGSEGVVPLAATAVMQSLEPGDRVVVASMGGGDHYVLDFDRKLPLLLLALITGALIAFFGRRSGILSVVAILIAIAIVALFVAPAIFEGTAAVPAALAGSLIALFVVVALGQGVGPRGLAAMLGGAASLILVAVLAALAVAITNLTGQAAAGVPLLEASGNEIHADGLLVAAMMVAVLGLLVDVAATHSRAAFQLRRDARRSFGELYRATLEAGRERVSANVTALALAWVGVTLPVLLLASSNVLGPLDTFNVEPLARLLVAMAVGAIGLVCAAPLTTAVATALARDLPPEPVPEPE